MKSIIVLPDTCHCLSDQTCCKSDGGYGCCPYENVCRPVRCFCAYALRVLDHEVAVADVWVKIVIGLPVSCSSNVATCICLAATLWQDLMLTVELYQRVNSAWHPLCWQKAKWHCWLVMCGPSVYGGLGAWPTYCGLNPALQFTSLQLPSKLLVTLLASYILDHAAYNTDLTPNDYYLLWNLTAHHCGVVSAIGDNEWLEALCIETANHFSAFWHHNLQWCHICNSL